MQDWALWHKLDPPSSEEEKCWEWHKEGLPHSQAQRWKLCLGAGIDTGQLHCIRGPIDWAMYYKVLDENLLPSLPLLSFLPSWRWIIDWSSNMTITQNKQQRQQRWRTLRSVHCLQTSVLQKFRVARVTQENKKDTNSPEMCKNLLKNYKKHHTPLLTNKGFSIKR